MAKSKKKKVIENQYRVRVLEGWEEMKRLVDALNDEWKKGYKMTHLIKMPGNEFHIVLEKREVMDIPYNVVTPMIESRDSTSDIKPKNNFHFVE